MTTTIHPLASPWGRFHLFSYLIDAPELAIVDTGVASSPAAGIAPALRALGRDVADVRWILLTHGHVDHLGGAVALWELTGRRASVVIHEADASFLRARGRHIDEYLGARARYVPEPDGVEDMTAFIRDAVSGVMEPTMLLAGGETLSLGGNVTVTAHHIPGHSEGSLAYVVDGQDDVFVGDAVQVHGAANGFPGYKDPDAYRASLTRLRDEIRPRHLYLGHPYQTATGEPYGVELDRDQARAAIEESLHIEARVRGAFLDASERGLAETDSPYSPFATVAEDLGYTRDPRPEPSPFFVTMHGYRTHLDNQHAQGASPR